MHPYTPTEGNDIIVTKLNLDSDTVVPFSPVRTRPLLSYVACINIKPVPKVQFPF